MAAQLELVHGAAPVFEPARVRPDHAIIARMVDDGSSVLDVGCGDGALISLLTHECHARARGLERDKAKVRGCVVRGLSVVQGDAETDLAAFPSGAFGFVVFSHTLQTLAHPREALRQAGRVGERVIVSIRNAGRWTARARLLGGRTGADWRDGTVERPTSVREFAELVREMRFGIETAIPLSNGKSGAPFARTLWRANMFAEEAVFLLTP